MSIDKPRQDKILKALHAIASTSPLHGGHRRLNRRTWNTLLMGAVVALGEESPPHWTVNLECGRSDRLVPQPPDVNNPALDAAERSQTPEQ